MAPNSEYVVVFSLVEINKFSPQVPHLWLVWNERTPILFFWARVVIGRKKVGWPRLSSLHCKIRWPISANTTNNSWNTTPYFWDTSQFCETQHKIIETQHKIVETLHKITETQYKIIETQRKVFETQHKIIETTQNIAGPSVGGHENEAVVQYGGGDGYGLPRCFWYL